MPNELKKKAKGQSLWTKAANAIIEGAFKAGIPKGRSMSSYKGMGLPQKKVTARLAEGSKARKQSAEKMNKWRLKKMSDADLNKK